MIVSKDDKDFWDKAFIAYSAAFFQNTTTTNMNTQILSVNSFKAAIEDASTCAEIALKIRNEKVAHD